MLNDILNAANKYADGLKHVQDKRAQWLVKHKELKTHLKEIADYLNANATYKQGFFIDTLHAFNEDINGTCADMPSITFRSGEMSMLVTFRNSLGERKEYMENGFHITFNPTITGQIVVLLFPHYSDLNKTPPPYITLAIVDDPSLITMDFAEEVISKGMQAAYYTSFTGMSEQGEKQSKPNHNHLTSITPLALNDMKQQNRLSKHNRLFLFGLLFLAACNNETKPTSTGNAVDSNARPVPSVISCNIVNEYPHDPSAFTEGLEYKDGFLYEESTGQYGYSDIRKVDLITGKVLLNTKMEARYFGEGLTVLNGNIYQLTYREGKGFVYNMATLKQERTFTFNAPEGWGMTNNGAQLIFDDGTNVLHFTDPNTFKEVKRLEVTDEHGPVNEINELELIHGFIYANQWETADDILKIDTSTGFVVGRADLSNLRQSIGIPQPSGNPHAPDVLNGIAYDATGNRIFITGKNWPKLLEVKLDN